MMHFAAATYSKPWRLPADASDWKSPKSAETLTDIGARESPRHRQIENVESFRTRGWQAFITR